MQYAIIEDSGSQLKVRSGDVIEVDLRDLADDAKTVTFDRVLLIGDGEKAAKIGTPYIGGASVTADIVEREVKGEKIDIVKYKRRKNYKRKQGHRQRYMLVKVSGIKG
ncbi:MAG: 50S ribosomal protein L21 [Phycisphaerales bacterium]|nr:50S ribosomal protein L21 [Phycisphaerales bacterium]